MSGGRGSGDRGWGWGERMVWSQERVCGSGLGLESEQGVVGHRPTKVPGTRRSPLQAAELAMVSGSQPVGVRGQVTQCSGNEVINEQSPCRHGAPR